MKLLITKSLPEDQLTAIRSWGWDVDVIPTLRIEQRQVEQIPASDAWVVSSRNSLTQVNNFITRAPAVIYTIGGWFPIQLQGLTNAEIKTFPEMTSLAQDLARSSARTVLYFCADNHREELEQTLRGTGKQMIKIITHTSTLTYPKVDHVERYDAILVFSPRSVESLIHQNHIPKNTLMATIGPTTDDFIRSLGFRNTLSASKPDSGVLLKELHDHFKKITKLPQGL